MAQVNLKFRNNTYTVDSDTPARLEELAEKINSKAQSLAGSSAHVPDAKLAFLTALMSEDEIEGLQKQIANQSVSSASEETKNDELCSTLDKVSSYIEELALRLEKE